MPPDESLVYTLKEAMGDLRHELREGFDRISSQLANKADLTALLDVSNRHDSLETRVRHIEDAMAERRALLGAYREHIDEAAQQVQAIHGRLATLEAAQAGRVAITESRKWTLPLTVSLVGLVNGLLYLLLALHVL